MTIMSFVIFWCPLKRDCSVPVQMASYKETMFQINFFQYQLVEFWNLDTNERLKTKEALRIGIY